MNLGLAAELKSHASERLGFDLVGIADAAPLPGSGRLRAWVAAGMNGEMEFMAGDREGGRAPQAFLPGARSVVCVAMACHDEWEPAETVPRGRRVVVARYARRGDYHDVIKRRLVRLGRLLAARAPGARWRLSVDTAPLLERELAQRAGLGWIGKNCSLINRTLGSDLLLGVLVTDVALPVDTPERDHCGRCDACLQACPTRAFVAPALLDARRCISYLTIEHRSSLPGDLAPLLGAHLFGCDICQAVCPWNRRAPPRCAAALTTRPHLAELDLERLAVLDAAGWFEVAKGTPLRRLSFTRFRRNLDAVARNIGTTERGDG